MKTTKVNVLTIALILFSWTFAGLADEKRIIKTEIFKIKSNYAKEKHEYITQLQSGPYRDKSIYRAILFQFGGELDLVIEKKESKGSGETSYKEITKAIHVPFFYESLRSVKKTGDPISVYDFSIGDFISHDKVIFFHDGFYGDGKSKKFILHVTEKKGLLGAYFTEG